MLIISWLLTIWRPRVPCSLSTSDLFLLNLSYLNSNEASVLAHYFDNLTYCWFLQLLWWLNLLLIPPLSMLPLNLRCILLLIWRVSSSSYSSMIHALPQPQMYPPPYDMYPPPHIPPLSMLSLNFRSYSHGRQTRYPGTHSEKSQHTVDLLMALHCNYTYTRALNPENVWHSTQRLN